MLTTPSSTGKTSPVKAIFTKVKKGTIIVDKYQVEDDYYILTTAHNNLYIHKSQVQLVWK